MSVKENKSKAKGSIKEGMESHIGDEKMEKEGAAEKVVSKVRSCARDTKDARRCCRRC